MIRAAVAGSFSLYGIPAPKEVGLYRLHKRSRRLQAHPLVMWAVPGMKRDSSRYQRRYSSSCTAIRAGEDDDNRIIETYDFVEVVLN